MHKGIFVTATGTEVGKTYVSCKIAESLKKLRINVGVFKPVSTGDRNDAQALIKAAKIQETLETVTPIFFNNPMSPYGASLLEKKQLNLKKIYSTFKYFLNKYEFIIVEGIGGLMVPLKENFFVNDLIKKMNLPTIIVTEPGLGTINHTLLTIEKLKNDKQKILGIILSRYGNKYDISAKSNAKIIKKITGLPIFELGYNKKIKLKGNEWIIK
ncbi:MAG: dethiobiotin synthase [Endomicrobium sp.]|jgi:dethiobiotin synthetase|nr:dethiobiotin synthase [Endomicrobium sp.]